MRATRQAHFGALSRRHRRLRLAAHDAGTRRFRSRPRLSAILLSRLQPARRAQNAFHIFEALPTGRSAEAIFTSPAS